MARRGRPRKIAVVAPVVKDYTRHAIWLLVAYQVFFTILVLVSINSLWKAII